MNSLASLGNLNRTRTIDLEQHLEGIIGVPAGHLPHHLSVLTDFIMLAGGDRQPQPGNVAITRAILQAECDPVQLLVG